MASKRIRQGLLQDPFFTLNYEDDDFTWDNEEDEKAILSEVKEIYGISTFDKTNFKQEVASDEKEKNYEKNLEEEIDKLDDKDGRSCASCTKHTRVVCPSTFKRGQHIAQPGEHGRTHIKFLRKQICPYDHHMIVKEVLYTSKDKAQLVLIHFSQSDEIGKIKIIESILTVDLRYDEVYVVEYRFPLYQPDTIVQRAEQVLQTTRKDQFEKYNLLSGNCEHFATWCVIGQKECSQIQSVCQILRNGASYLFGQFCAIGKGLVRVLSNSADEIVSAISKVLPSVVLSGIAGVYLIYCIIMTAVNIKRYRKDKELCWSCLKKKLLGLWLSFLAFGVTSGIQLIFWKFALPLIPSPFGIPLLIILFLLSIGIQKSVPTLLNMLRSPITAHDIEIKNIDEIEVGDLLELRYFKLNHIVLVTEVHRSKVRAIHYAAPSNIFEKRMVKEEYFDIDLSKSGVKKKSMLMSCYLADVAVERARKRLGETKFDIRTSRSSHLCNWAKVKRHIKPQLPPNEHLPDTKSNDLSSLLVEKREVHLVEELEKGDVAIVGMLKDKKGIILDIKGIWGHTIMLELMVHTGFKVHRKKYYIDLQTERIYVNKYVAGLCKPMSERVKTALQMEGKLRVFLTDNKFVEACIMLNPK